MSYTKLHREILDSTVWLEELHIKVVWITMLAMRDDRHEVQASIPGLAKRAGVTVEQCEESLVKFLASDAHSRSQDYEGRRIEAVRGGWRLLNGDYYQKRQSKAEKSAYNRLYMENKRLVEKINKYSDVGNSSKSNFSNECSTVEKSRVEKRRDINIYRSTDVDQAPTKSIYSNNFEQFWSLYPRKIGKQKAWKSWKRHKCNDLLDSILSAVKNNLESKQWKENGGEFIPHPTTWLNRGGWEDEVFKLINEWDSF